MTELDHPPRDAVRIHLQKDRWPRRNDHAFRFKYSAKVEEPQEPENPYKSDPRFGTWG